METNNQDKKLLLPYVLTALIAITASGIVFYAGTYIGKKLAANPDNSITVTGIAFSEKSNSVAQFNADVTKTNVEKQIAVEELNTAINDIKAKVLEFGIPENDIKTNFFNVYQNSEWNPDTQQSKLTDWSATVSLGIKLRDVNKAGELSTLLATLDTTYLNGPNFSLERDEAQNDDLLAAAIENARKKAQNIATATNKEVGEVMSIDETNSRGEVTPLYKDAVAMGAGMIEADALVMEPGNSEVSKTVTVTFRLK